MKDKLMSFDIYEDNYDEKNATRLHTDIFKYS